MRILFTVLCLMSLDVFAYGDIITTPNSSRQTFSIQFADVTPVATATDIITITGQTGKVIRINKLEVSGDATGVSVVDFYFYKRFAANTGGIVFVATATSASTCIATESTYASIKLYSANPSALGYGQLIKANHYALLAAISTGYPGAPWVEEFGTRNDQKLVLRGPAESLSFNLNGATLPAGLNVYVAITCTEE